jgi:hypothetical protein
MLGLDLHVHNGNNNKIAALSVLVTDGEECSNLVEVFHRCFQPNQGPQSWPVRKKRGNI